MRSVRPIWLPTSNLRSLILTVGRAPRAARQLSGGAVSERTSQCGLGDARWTRYRLHHPQAATWKTTCWKMLTWQIEEGQMGMTITILRAPLDLLA
jgi:hypothetical protein